MLKKIIALTLSLVLAFSLAAVCTASAEEAEPTAQTAPSESAYEVKISNGVGVLFCKEPGDENTALMFIPDGSPLHITEIKDGYGKTVFRGTEGWIPMEYLNDTGVTDPLVYICEDMETFRKIMEMTESDKLLLSVHLKAPVVEGTGMISVAELGLTAEEFEEIKRDLAKMEELACKAFVEEYSLQEATTGRTIFQCKLSLEDINRIKDDERLIGLYWYLRENLDTDTDYEELEDIQECEEVVGPGCETEEVDTDENWISEIDQAGNLIIPGGATLETWKYYIEKYSLKYYVDAEDNLIIPAEEALRFWRGDANVDGSLDMLDVTATQKHIAKLDAECNTLLADMDGNGAVDLQDVVQMQKTIADII